MYALIKHRFTFYIILGSLLSILSCGKQYNNPKTTVIKDQKNLEDFNYKNLKRWNPSNKDLKIIDSITKIGFEQETSDFEEQMKYEFDEYSFQIVPILKNGKKVAYINALCHAERNHFNNWKTWFYYVYDGGDCFWQMEIDLENKNHFNFSVNGQ